MLPKPATTSEACARCEASPDNERTDDHRKGRLTMTSNHWLTREAAADFARVMSLRTGQTYYIAETATGRWTALTRAQYVRGTTLPYVAKISTLQAIR